MRKRERELHASKKCGHVISVPHSLSQSACVIIIIIIIIIIIYAHIYHAYIEQEIIKKQE